MNREEVFYLIPYLLSLGLSLGILIYTWRHRHVRGARVYSWFMVGQTLTILGYILELVSPNLQTKILWDKFQWLTFSFLAIVPFLVFAIQYSEYTLRYPRLTWGSWLALPILFTALLLTDGVHHLLYPHPQLSTDYPFPELQYDFTIIVYAYTVIYFYGVNFYGLSLLIRRAIQPHNLYRSQYLIIAAGFFIPLAFSVFSLANIKIAPQRDAGPFSLAMGNLIVAWGLCRYRLFDIVPFARERIVENLRDPVFVLDDKNRVLDVNHAALKMVHKEASEVVRHHSRDVFAKWPVIVNELEYLDVERREIAIQENGDTFYFDVNISSIHDNQRQLLGRIVAARDITRYKTLESGYRLLSGELEQRVRERTDELRHSAELYRTVVENQTEFIVRWRSNGVRTFVNEAYCRYFGLTPEQALSSSFIPLIVEEDRHAMEEKISRLQSGMVNSETETHRVIKPDGSVGWQEWTDQAIRDEKGNIIEFQSIGRDITERKLAEEGLLKQLAFDELMTHLLARFATCAYNEVDSSIEIGLKEISEFMEIDYADILILSEDRKTWKITYQWSAAHLSPSIHPTQSIPTGELVWSEIKLFQGEAIKINTFDDYPAEAQIDRRFSESEGTKSLLSVPIRGQEQLTFGCIDLISYTNQINWSDSDVTHMKIIGDSIANLLERKRAEENLAEAYDTTLEGWAKALELRDKETEGHSRRVTEATVAVARAMEINDEQLTHIRRGSILHDIGKMGIPDDILRKNGPLTAEERAIVQKHPTTAYELLKPITYLENALDIPYCHHEKWDGTGYPRALKGEEIPLAARIFAVVDVWDALSSDRPYRSAWPQEKVAQYLIAESGKHFDPQVMDVFLQMMKKGEI
jgi:PAS domain S-box-containing protein